MSFLTTWIKSWLRLDSCLLFHRALPVAVFLSWAYMTITSAFCSKPATVNNLDVFVATTCVEETFDAILTFECSLRCCFAWIHWWASIPAKWHLCWIFFAIWAKMWTSALAYRRKRWIVTSVVLFLNVLMFSRETFKFFVTIRALERLGSLLFVLYPFCRTVLFPGVSSQDTVTFKLLFTVKAIP